MAVGQRARVVPSTDNFCPRGLVAYIRGGRRGGVVSFGTVCGVGTWCVVVIAFCELRGSFGGCLAFLGVGTCCSVLRVLERVVVSCECWNAVDVLDVLGLDGMG